MSLVQRVAPLDTSFFARETPTVARELLGHEVRVPGEEGPLVGRIIETEAYLGPDDPGSHATRGRGGQAARLWDEPRLAYVYVCYGIHQMFNVVAHPPGGVGAVLLRAVEPVEGLAAMRGRRGDVDEARLADGPGKLAEAFGVTRAAHEGTDLTTAEGLHLARGRPVDASSIEVTGRIGLSAGGDRLLRFVADQDRLQPRAVVSHNG